MKSSVAAVATALKEEKYEDAFRLYSEKISPTATVLDQELSKDLDLNLVQSKVFVADSQIAYEQTRLIVITCILGGVLLGTAALAFIFRSINKPLQLAIMTADHIAEGQLSNDIQIESKDEFGQLLRALQRMDGKLSGMVQDIKRSSESIATASGEIATGNMDLSSRTEQQASSLEEIAASIEELTSTVKQNADNARQANSMAVTASEIATQGGVVVGEVVETMSSINESSKRIVDIINVIDGIAFQTNILALNAAVEAARAGEQGRGFAVVASEVRSLAQRSATAAKEIKFLIDDSVGKVDVGSRLVEKAGGTMSEIVSSIKRVTDIGGEIAAASQEQSIGIEQVNQSVTQMDEVTQQNAALVEEAAAAAQSMQEQASKLAQVVSMFTLHTQRA